MPVPILTERTVSVVLEFYYLSRALAVVLQQISLHRNFFYFYIHAYIQSYYFDISSFLVCAFKGRLSVMLLSFFSTFESCKEENV